MEYNCLKGHSYLLYANLKEIFRKPKLDTNKYLFLKVAIMNREKNTNIFKRTEHNG